MFTFDKEQILLWIELAANKPLVFPFFPSFSEQVLKSQKQVNWTKNTFHDIAHVGYYY